jgi:hypothetical protein
MMTSAPRRQASGSATTQAIAPLGSCSGFLAEFVEHPVAARMIASARETIAAGAKARHWGGHAIQHALCLRQLAARLWCNQGDRLPRAPGHASWPRHPPRRQAFQTPTSHPAPSRRSRIHVIMSGREAVVSFVSSICAFGGVRGGGGPPRPLAHCQCHQAAMLIESLTTKTVALEALATAFGTLPEPGTADWGAVAEISSATVWGSWVGFWDGGKLCYDVTKLLASHPEHARDVQVLAAMDQAKGALSATVLQAAVAIVQQLPDTVARLTRGLGAQLRTAPVVPSEAADAAKADLAALLAICAAGSEHLGQCAEMRCSPKGTTAVGLMHHFLRSLVGLLTLFSECLAASSTQHAACLQPYCMCTRLAFLGTGGGQGRWREGGACGSGSGIGPPREGGWGSVAGGWHYSSLLERWRVLPCGRPVTVSNRCVCERAVGDARGCIVRCVPSPPPFPAPGAPPLLLWPSVPHTSTSFGTLQGQHLTRRTNSAPSSAPGSTSSALQPRQ